MGSWALYMNDAETVFGVSRNGPTTIAEFTAQRARGEDGYVSHTTWFVRRDVLLAAGGYDSSFDSTEDLELLDRIAELGPTLTIPEPLVLYRVHSGSVSTKTFTRQHELARYVRERRRARLVGRTFTRDEYIRREPERSVIDRASTGLQMFSAVLLPNRSVAYSGRPADRGVAVARRRRRGAPCLRSSAAVDASVVRLGSSRSQRSAALRPHNAGAFSPG